MKKILLLLLCTLLLTGCGREIVIQPYTVDTLDTAGNDPVETAPIAETLPAEETLPVEETLPEETGELILPVEESWFPSGNVSFMYEYEPYWIGEEEGTLETIGDMEITYVNSMLSDDVEYEPLPSEDLLYWRDVIEAFAEDGYYTHALVHDYATFQSVTLYDERTGYDCTVTVYKCAMYGDDNSTAVPQVDAEFEITKGLANNEIESSTGIDYLNAEVHDNYVICNLNIYTDWKYSAKNNNLLFEATIFGLVDNDDYNNVMREICDHTMEVFLNIK